MIDSNGREADDERVMKRIKRLVMCGWCSMVMVMERAKIERRKEKSKKHK